MSIQTLSKDDAPAYRTARFSALAHASQRGLPKRPLRVKFFTRTFNFFYQRNECLFHVYADAYDETLIGTYFENALYDFKE